MKHLAALDEAAEMRSKEDYDRGVLWTSMGYRCAQRRGNVYIHARI